MPDTTIKQLPPGSDIPSTIDVDSATQQMIARLITQYGEVVKVIDEKRSSLSYVVVNPDAIKTILISKHEHYIKGAGFERVKMLLGNGIIVSDGDFWRRQRTMIQPAFSKKNIHKLCQMIQNVTDKLAIQWQKKAENKQVLDITTEMSEFSLEVILRALISDDLDIIIEQEQGNPFSFLTEDTTRNLAVAMRFRQLGKLLQKIIDKRRELQQHFGDLLDALMSATDKKGNVMSDKELIDELMTMIIAGHETSAGTLNWLWYELSQNEDEQQKVVEEAREKFTSDKIEIEQIAQLKYTKQCLNEILRLYPPVWIFSRKAVVDTSIEGYFIAAGSNVFLCPYYTQRLPRLWEKPNQFHPEHFADDSAKLKHKYAFYPFSAGSRRCIGEYFSYVEMQIHIATLIKQFKLTALPNQKIEIEPAINLRTKHNIMMKISQR